MVNVRKDPISDEIAELFSAVEPSEGDMWGKSTAPRARRVKPHRAFEDPWNPSGLRFDGGKIPRESGSE
jgi:hypothetical protein